jgi:Putative Flp pilus-assembly TadE/G-like
MVSSRSKKGFVLILTCIVLTILLGLAGLGIDIGRMYVIQSELQAFSDAAALNAALQLDGTERGIERARRAASEFATGPHAMKWDLGSQPINDITVSFPAGTSHSVRVVVSAPAPLIFLRALPAGKAGFSTVAVSSVAAKTAEGARLIQ